MMFKLIHMSKLLKLLVLPFLAYFFISCDDENLYIIIENKTKYNISNISIIDTLETEYITIKLLDSGKSYKVKINNSMDNSVSIRYRINNKFTKKIAIGYVYNKMQGTEYFTIK